MTTPAIAKWMLISGALLMGLSVAFGAIGSHALQSYFDDSGAENVERRLENWETAVRYQTYHALAFLALGATCRFRIDGLMKYGFGCLLVGVLLFSGMLYSWVLLQNRVFVMIVPLGGLSLIAGWVLVFSSFVRLR